MSRPTKFEHFRWVGDKRVQRVHDLDNSKASCDIDELMQSEEFICFGPDTLTEARNRCYKPCPQCASGDAA